MIKQRKNIKKEIIVIIAILVIAGLIFLIINTDLTGRIIQNYTPVARDYKTYTKAICDENNYCQDYEIICENKKVVNISPITGANIQHSENWEDPRPNKSEIICE